MLVTLLLVGVPGSAENTDDSHLIPSAAPLSFKAGVDKSSVGLAEPFHLTIEIRHTADETYELPARLELGPFGLRDKKRLMLGDDTKTTRIELELQAFEVGEKEIPSIRLVVDTPGGVRTLELPPHKVTVAGIIDDRTVQPSLKEDLRPLPIRVVRRWWPLFVPLAIAALAALGWWLWKRSKRPKTAPPPKPRDPPDVEAMARLRALEDQQLLARGEIQPHYFQLSEIVREYVGRRFEFDALELTTEELLQAVRKRSTPGLDVDAFRALLDTCDFAKFAKASPTDTESKQALELAHRLVERTRPPPPVPPNGGRP